MFRARSTKPIAASAARATLFVAVASCFAGWWPGAFGSLVYGSCGDWLEHEAAFSEALAATAAPDAGQSKPAPRSCHGPMCQQAPARPMSPLPVRIDWSPRELALIRSMSELTLFSSHSFGLAEGDDFAVSGFPSRLERPPKA